MALPSLTKAYGLWTFVFGSPRPPAWLGRPGKHDCVVVCRFFPWVVVEKATSLVNLAILGSRVFHRNEWRPMGAVVSTVTISLFSVHHQRISDSWTLGGAPPIPAPCGHLRLSCPTPSAFHPRKPQRRARKAKADPIDSPKRLPNWTKGAFSLVICHRPSPQVILCSDSRSMPQRHMLSSALVSAPRWLDCADRVPVARPWR
jgi:hypothetical protein